MRLSLFPLPGALLFPRLRLPLHIFEPRYRALIRDTMARDRRLGIIQPRDMDSDHPPLYDIGCIGNVVEIEALEDGRFNLILEGITRFRMVEEILTDMPFRQAEVEPIHDDEVDPAPLPFALRAALEMESRTYADTNGYQVDWKEVTALDDETLVNAIAQIAPFDIAAKQALLEAPGLNERAETIIQLMQFFSGRPTDGDRPVTLQ